MFLWLHILYKWNISPDPGITWKTCSLREERDFFAGGTRKTPAKNSQREDRSLSRHVGIILLSGGWGSVWGSSRRLQVFYVIPGSGVIVHMYSSPMLYTRNRRRRINVVLRGPYPCRPRGTLPLSSSGDPAFVVLRGPYYCRPQGTLPL